MASTRLGLFGGTFDPPHLGHVRAITAALDQLDLERIVVTVANDPWRKPDAPTASPALRLEMARAAFAGMERVEVSDLEIARGGPTYTIDTVEALLASEAQVAVVVILGADAAAGLAEWHRADDLARLVTVAVVPRPGSDGPQPGEFRLVAVQMDPVDLSSTSVREALAAGEDPSDLLPAGVIPFLAAHPLYSP
jgi:nicotinate-nucleotide adenylyltransferase